MTIGSGGINLQAVASSHRGGGAFAVAIAVIIQDDVAVHGGIAVKANAFNGAGGEGDAVGIAALLLQANSGDVTVDGAIDVEALASDQGAGNASAGALTLILAQAGATRRHYARVVDRDGKRRRFRRRDGEGTGGRDLGRRQPRAPSTISRSSAIWSSMPRPTTTPDSAATISAPPPTPLLSLSDAHDIEVGGLVSLGARGTNSGAGLVNAHADLGFDIASNIDLGGVQIDVEARREGVTGAGPGANATASFVMNDPAVNLSIGALGLNVQALASSAGGQGALANALVDITQDNLVHRREDHRRGQCLQRLGRGRECPRSWQPRPACHHRRYRGRELSAVAALAVDSGAGNAVASGLVNAFANGDGKITAGMITDRARASNAGAGYAQSLALTHLDAGGTIHIGGARVVATANKASGAQGHGIGASANAAFVVDHTTKLTVDHTVSVKADRGESRCLGREGAWRDRFRQRPDDQPRRGRHRRLCPQSRHRRQRLRRQGLGGAHPEQCRGSL